MTAVRSGVVTGGVSYHHALTAPGEVLGEFAELNIHELTGVDLERFELLLVLRSVDNEALWSRRHQFERFLFRGGVLVAFGEAWTNWFPGCAWHPEDNADLSEPVLSDHPLLHGLTGQSMHWHGKGPRWCNHGHFVPPPGAETLACSSENNVFAYIDRQSTNGVILAASNLDLDTHSFHGNSVARELFGRVLAWAESEASLPRPALEPRIAGLYSGVHFQRGFLTDPEFGRYFAILPATELGGVELDRYPALWIPRESNQQVLCAQREKIERYLRGGGTIVTFEEPNQPWLGGVTWRQQSVDLGQLSLRDHPLVAGLSLEDVHWHSHGALLAPPGADVLIGAGADAVLYLDEVTFAPGKALIGTLDPDCHVGYGSDRPRALLRALVAWALDPKSSRVAMAV